MDLRQYIEDRAVPEPNSGCWLWERSTDRYGYACVGLRKYQHIRAHRLAYEAYVGAIPNGMMVCHKCDVRCCVNPDHLFLGSHKENMSDMTSKRRQACGPRHPQNTRPLDMARGSRVNTSKLTEPKVQLAMLLKSLGSSSKHVSEWLGVAQTSIQRVWSGQNWNHFTKLRSERHG